MRWLSVADFKSNRSLHLVTLLLVSLAMSISLHLTYLPWWCGDSITYSAPAHAIYTGTVWTYPIARTLGYPFFLFCCELLASGETQRMPTPFDGQVITWIQSLLTIASVLMTYLAMERLQIRPVIAFAMALAVALLDGLALPQMMIMTETLSLFLVMLGTYLATVAIDRFRRGLPLGLIPLLGGLAWGAAIVVRTNLIFLWIIFIGAIPLWITWQWLRRRKFETKSAATKVSGPCLAGGLVMLSIWLFVNYQMNGVISLSVIAEIVYTSPVYNMFDQVHPEDKVLGDIMVKHYHLTNHDDVEQRDYVNATLPELQANAAQMPLKHVEGRPHWVDFYMYIGAVSRQLMLEHPREWMANSLDDLRHTFDFHFDQTNPHELKDPVSLRGVPVVISVTGWKIHSQVAAAQSWLILILYLLTYAAIPVALRKLFTAADITSALEPLTVAALAAGSLSCITATCFLACYFTRYSAPVIPVFAICAGYVVETYAARREKGSRRRPLRRSRCASTRDACVLA